MNTGPEALSPGDILQNRYVIICKIGGGGMGTLYKASDSRMANRDVAIKEMKQHNLNTAQLEQARRRFEREAALLSLAQNEHLPRVYNFFEEQGRYYLVMQFIEGETLLRQLERKQGPLPMLVILAYAIQLCDALTHLHTRRDPIIFRDLKPANIMIQPDGHLFLIDFGIARNFKIGQTSDTEIFGTPGYIPPEMAVTQTNARSDLFSLSVTLHYALSCQLPAYVERNRVFIPALSSRLGGSAELHELILKMVQIAPDMRPNSAAEVKRQLERIYRQILADQVNAAQAASYSGFYADQTEPGTRFLPRWRSPLTRLEKLPGLLLRGVALLLLPLMVVASKVLAVAVSEDVRRDLYDRYLFLRARLNNTGIWSARFLLLLVSILTGTIALSTTIYSHFGASIERVEFGLAFVLLVTIILIGGQLNNPVPRNIMLCSGFCVTIAFLTLLTSAAFQTAPDGSAQSVTVNLLMISGLITITSIALLGAIVIRKHYSQGTKPAHGFTRLSHAGVAAVAGVCFLMQFAFGRQEQIIFFPSTFRPFATALSPGVTLNIVPLIVLVSVGVISLLRFSQPFKGFDRVMLFILCLLYVPVQYTFGLNALNHAFPTAFQPGLVIINLLMLAVPLLLAFLAFFPLPGHMAWVMLLPLFAVSLGVGWLQGFLGNEEPFSMLSSNSQQVTENLPHLSIFGQVVFFSLAIALVLLCGGVFFSRRRTPARARGRYSSTRANTGATSRIPNAADRIGLLSVTLSCGAVQWAFWQRMLQNAPTLTSSAQSVNALYAPLVSLGVGYAAMALAFLATGIAAASTLFNLSQNHPRVEGLLKFMDRVTVLGVAIISLLLLSFFGNNGGWLASSINLNNSPSPESFSSSGSSFTIHFSLILIILIAFFSLLALFRLTRAFGWAERTLMLLCGIGVMLMLTDTLDMQQLSLLSASAQYITGNL
ncbi:MAG TPA: serine/threonine-protein kinase, partial [Ktedonobacteraceae bacterium]|nr:serine/threonine-protein kinase [Ktedonobacteraceae bacterium]